jgi:hypothetical protein
MAGSLPGGDGTGDGDAGGAAHLSATEGAAGSSREPYKFWVPLADSSREAAGEVLISVEMLPAAEAERLRNGIGRSEPNANPKLPPPTGRLKLSLNPFVMGFRLLGPKLCGRLLLMVGLALGVFLLYSMLPVLLADGVESIISHLG